MPAGKLLLGDWAAAQRLGEGRNAAPSLPRYQGLRLLDRARWHLLGRVADPHAFYAEPPHR